MTILGTLFPIAWGVILFAIYYVVFREHSVRCFYCEHITTDRGMIMFCENCAREDCLVPANNKTKYIPPYGRQRGSQGVEKYDL